MLDLVIKIDNAWNEKASLINVDPHKCNGYFDFRNKVVLKSKEECEKCCDCNGYVDKFMCDHCTNNIMGGITCQA